jgi:hypothetical protein
MSSSLFRLIAGVTRNIYAANNFGTFTIILLLLLSGFILSSGNYKASIITSNLKLTFSY